MLKACASSQKSFPHGLWEVDCVEIDMGVLESVWQRCKEEKLRYRQIQRK